MSRCPHCHGEWAPDHLFCPKDGTQLIHDADSPTIPNRPSNRGDLPGVPAESDVLDDKYRLLRVIGKGGVGVVFEARHLRIDRPVAIKVLRPEVVGDETQVARFAEEARLAGQLGHDNIVEILDLETPEVGPPYIVMELLEGESLAEHLKRDPILRPERALHIAMGVLDALAAAHRAEIVHRDVKPGNIFLARKEGRGEVIKLLDFGIARALRTNTRITAPGRAVGTAVFMPPEQIMATEVDARADLYAVAAVLYLTLMGQPPFSGGSWAELARAKLAATVPPLQGLDSAIALHAEQAIRHGLERNPDDRPESAVAFHEELALVLEVAEDRSSHRASKAPTLVPGQLRRVAVLPFEADSVSDQSLWAAEALALGIYDDLSSRIGQRLVSRTAVQAAQCAGAHECLSNSVAIGHQLGADFVISGTLDETELDPRIEIRVHEVDSAEMVTRCRQTGSLEEIFRLLSPTLESIGRPFKLSRRPEDCAPLLPSSDYEAFRDYARLVAEAAKLRSDEVPDGLVEGLDALVVRHPRHGGLRRERARLLLDRAEKGDSPDVDVELAHADLELLATWASADPWIPTGRARLRSTSRWFAPREAVVLAEETRIVTGLDPALLLEHAGALENLGLVAEAAQVLSTTIGRDGACGPAILRLALLSMSPLLQPPRPGEPEASRLDRAAYLIRSAHRLRGEERAEGRCSSSARRGWPPLPSPRVLEALLAVKRGDSTMAAGLLDRVRLSPTDPFFLRAALATVRAESEGDDGMTALTTVVDGLEDVLARPGSPEVVEVAFAAPDAWSTTLEHRLETDPERRRSRVLLATIRQVRRDLDGCLAELRILVDQDSDDAIGVFAAEQATRLAARRR